MNEETTNNKRDSAADDNPRETAVEFFASMAGLLATVLFIMTFVFQTFAIPSSSMEDTLLIGDHVLVDRERFAAKTPWIGPLIPYREIRRGDTAVFLSPEQPGLFLVKRIIGVPGDRIHLHDGVVYRNGEKLVEPYVKHVSADENPPFDEYRDNFPAVPPLSNYVRNDKWREEMPKHIERGDIVVPPDSYFAMGDNRDVSYDSRFWGFVPRANLIGRPLVIYWSIHTSPEEYENQGLGDRFQSFLHTVVHFFDETRWGRSFRIVR
ncbi:MAG TPA: signal peptidase I [Terriglobales bacterium]|nr:signal peptidase I [Terriglobales bacterium]